MSTLKVLCSKVSIQRISCNVNHVNFVKKKKKSKNQIMLYFPLKSQIKNLVGLSIQATLEKPTYPFNGINLECQIVKAVYRSIS